MAVDHRRSRRSAAPSVSPASGSARSRTTRSKSSRRCPKRKASRVAANAQSRRLIGRELVSESQRNKSSVDTCDRVRWLLSDLVGEKEPGVARDLALWGANTQDRG